MDDGRCAYCSCRSTVEQMFKKCMEYEKDILVCVFKLEKAQDRFPRDKLWRVLRATTLIDFR